MNSSRAIHGRPEAGRCRRVPTARACACLAIVAAALSRAVAADNPVLSPIFTPVESIDIRHIKLELHVDLPRKHVDAVATLTMTPLVPATSVRLDAVGLDVSDVIGSIGEQPPRPIASINDGRRLELLFGRTVEPGTPITVRIAYAVHEPKDGLHFFGPGPGDDDPDAPLQVWSQGQSISNRFWIPCLDHPGEMQTSETIITVASGFQALSNGVLVSTKEDAAAGTTTFHWRQEQPHVVYLVTLVVGQFQIVEETWRGIPVSYWAPRDRAADIQRTFGRTLAMLDFFSDKLGVKYPWPKYAQVCCYQYGGGMEHTSATTLGENCLHDERSFIDASSDDLIAHELAHQWFGDLLTCREWAHLWLNEGFASYFEALWDEQDHGQDEFAWNMYEKARDAINGGKQFPIVHRGYTDPGQQFDSRAYPKGAWVLHMLRRRIGDDAFWKVMNKHITDNLHKTVETADLRRAAEQVTGRSFERFFFDWTERPGHPVLDVTIAWNEQAKTADVTVKQTQEAEAFHFPLVIEFTPGGDGGAPGGRVAPAGDSAVSARDDAPSGGAVPVMVRRDMTEKQLSLVVPLPAPPSMVRVDPGNTVLKEITEHKGRELWVAQLRGDPDPVGRIRAARALQADPSQANRQTLAAALAAESFWAVRSEIAAALGEMGGDVARDALIAALASEHPKVRRAAADALGKFPRDPAALAAVRGVIDKGDASFRVEAAAISAYARLGGDDVLKTVSPALQRDSFRETVRTAAINALGDVDDPQAAGLLADWCAAGRPVECREAAVRALARAAARRGTQAASLEKSVEAIAACLKGESRRMRTAAAESLGQLGGLASSVLGRVRDAAAFDPHERVREAARAAAQKIDQDVPAQQQLADLRKQVDDLAAANRELKAVVEELRARLRGVVESQEGHAGTRGEATEQPVGSAP